MKKIMFNDLFHLTEAVLNGTKTQTRRLAQIKHDVRIVECRLCDSGMCIFTLFDMQGEFNFDVIPYYNIGEIVAIAQSYNEIGKPQRNEYNKEVAGNTNKMFVKSEMMPHQIEIIDIRFERLQDITDEDCLKEGIKVVETPSSRAYSFGCRPEIFATPREAYAHLIDKIGGRGTWESNPYVFVYDFELVK